MEELKLEGVWKIEKTEFKGELHIIKNKKMIRLVLKEKNSDSFFNEKDFPDKLDIITGKTFLHDVNISLLYCKTLRRNLNFSTGITTYLIDCKYCIYGLHFKNIDDVLFNKLQIRLTNTMEWSKLSGFTSKRGNKKIIEKIEYSFQKKITYIINENIKLEIVPYFGGGSYYLNSENILLKQHVKINIICKRLEKFDSIIEELNKFIALIEFCTREKINIVEINGFKNSKFYVIPNCRRRDYIPYRIYFYNEVDIKNDDDELNRRDRHFICDLNDICKANALQNWYNKYDDLKPIIDSYRKNLDNFEYFNEIPESEIFLNLTKSLEFYHTRFIAESLEEYNTIISSKLENALSENKDIINNFIYDDNQQQEDYVLLKNRLFHLFIEDMPISFFENINNIMNFVNSVVDTRHYYTHYNKSKQFKAMKGFELSLSNILLQTILECFILKELRFDSSFINNHRKNSWSQLKKFDIPRQEMKYLEKYKKIEMNTSIENILKIIIKDYDLGTLLNYNILECDDDDLYVTITTDKNKSHIIRFFSKSKTNDDCLEIINANKSKLIYTKKNFYTIYYFYGKYRIIIYKNSIH